MDLDWHFSFDVWEKSAFIDVDQYVGAHLSKSWEQNVLDWEDSWGEIDMRASFNSQ